MTADHHNPTPPMFPRLLLRDADNSAGPRAPPRNKMALYEYLTVPRSGVPQSAAAEIVQPHLFNAKNHRSARMELVRRSAGHATQRSSTAAAAAVTRLNYLSSATSAREEKVDDEDDCQVPTFERLTPLCANSVQNNNHAAVSLTGVSMSRANKSASRTETGDDWAVRSHEAALDQEQTSTRNFTEKPFQRDALVSLGSCGNGVLNEAVWLRDGMCDEESFRIKMTDDCGSDEKVSGSVEVKNANGNEEVSEDSIETLKSGLDTSPDDVVGHIGPKQFWKARSAIVNQQRVFAVQVFELHRLIKVQKLIAASPHLLLEEENQYLSRSPEQVTDENPPTEPCEEWQQQAGKQKDDSQKISESRECQTGETLAPPPTEVHDPNKVIHPLPRYDLSLNRPPPAPVTPEHKQASWCYPPANHWLVPVMSPSEGLIYKPYSGPCPPAGGFMAPAYGGSIPMSMPPVAGGFMNAAYGSPSSQEQQYINVLPSAPAMPPNFFPMPYGLPFANHNASAFAVEQANTIVRPRPVIHTEQRSSCNMASPRGEALSACPQKVHTPKGSELQGSTASSPCERAAAEARVAFVPISRPVAVKGSATLPHNHAAHLQPHVIKVVPHNKRSATESVARIFQSIQEERQQQEL